MRKSHALQNLELTIMSSVNAIWYTDFLKCPTKPPHHHHYLINEYPKNLKQTIQIKRWKPFSIRAKSPYINVDDKNSLKATQTHVLFPYLLAACRGCCFLGQWPTLSTVVSSGQDDLFPFCIWPLTGLLWRGLLFLLALQLFGLVCNPGLSSTLNLCLQFLSLGLV